MSIQKVEIREITAKLAVFFLETVDINAAQRRGKRLKHALRHGRKTEPVSISLEAGSAFNRSIHIEITVLIQFRNIHRLLTNSCCGHHKTNIRISLT